MDRLLVATLNILNLADRWAERLPLLLADMAALQPDLIGLQEVVYPMQQDRLLGAAGEGRYEAVRGWAGRPEYGNSLLVKAPLVATDVDRWILAVLDRASRPSRALRRLDARARGDAPPPPPTPTTRASPRSTALSPGSTPRHRRCPDRRRRLQRRPREPAYARMCAPGSARRTRRPTVASPR